MSNENLRWIETGRLAELGLLSSELIHELRQPVFALKATVQLLQSREADAHTSLLALLGDQIQTLEDLVQRYAASGRAAGDPLSPVLIAEPVHAAMELMRPRARALGKVLDLQGHGSVVRGDPVSLQQITTNLVSNALHAARTRVTVRLEPESIEVIDDGRGIPSDLRERIFEPFFTTKGVGEGTGLGLPITQHLVQHLGGQLSVDTDSLGSRFLVRLHPWAD